MYLVGSRTVLGNEELLLLESTEKGEESYVKEGMRKGEKVNLGQNP